ncbi:MAG: DinB family protein [Nakamurella sp.]
MPTPEPVDGPLVGAARPVLAGYLGWYRHTVDNICAGLTAEQFALRPIPSTALSLLGIVRHLAKVERIWLRQRLAADGTPPLYDPALGKDFDFEGGTAATAAHAWEALHAEQRAGDAAVSSLPDDHRILVGGPDGEQMSLQAVYTHLIGEYARHTGHADLLREAIDGVTGR